LGVPAFPATLNVCILDDVRLSVVPFDVKIEIGRRMNVPRQTSRIVAGISVSADLGPDLIASWRRPSMVMLHAETAISPAKLGAVEAERADLIVTSRVQARDKSSA